jgi:protein SMG6
MELDGLVTSIEAGEAAQNAMAYITSHVRSHSMSLNIQISESDYLTSLSVCIEQVDWRGLG